MKRAEVLKEIARQDALVVCNLGYPARELYSLADCDKIFYMLGSMGLASSVGLGLALSQERRVYAVDGDGSILMNMGTLATIANHGPDNLCLVIIDNRAYGSTGNQPTFTAGVTDLEEVARGAGIENTVRVRDIETLGRMLEHYAGQMAVIVAEAVDGNMEVPLIPIAPAEIKKRFMQYLK